MFRKIINFFNNVQKLLFYPLLLAGVMVLVKVAEHVFQFEGLYRFGIHPRKFSGLPGIITSPFLHGDLWHLFSNVVPLIFLGGLLFHFYKPLGYRVLLVITFSSGLWTWVIGRPNYHIGASGIVYGLVFFIFFSGLIRKHNPLRALGLVVVFLYGSLFWGMLPIDPHISWEAHLSGAAAGLLSAWWFREQGPQAPVHHWHDEPDDSEVQLEEDPHFKESELNLHNLNRPPDKPAREEDSVQQINIVYSYKPAIPKEIPGAESGTTDSR